MANVQRLGGAAVTGVCLIVLACSETPAARDAGAARDAARPVDLGSDGDASAWRDAVAEDRDSSGISVPDAMAARDGDSPDAYGCLGEYLPAPDPIDVTGWTSFGSVIEVGGDLVWIDRAVDSYRVIRTTAGLEAIDTSTPVRDVPSEVEGIPLNLGDGLAGPYLASTDDWLLLLGRMDGAIYARVYGTDGSPKSGVTMIWPTLAPSTRRVFASDVRSGEFTLIAVEVNADGGCGSGAYLRRASRLGEPGAIIGPVLLEAEVISVYPMGGSWILAGLDGCREDSLVSWSVDAEGRSSAPVALPMGDGVRTFLTLLRNGTWARLDERRPITGGAEVALTLLEAVTGEIELPTTSIWSSRGRIADWGSLEVGPDGELAWAFSEFVGRGSELETTQQRFVRINGGRVLQDTILARMDSLNLTPATSLLRWRGGHYVAQWGLSGYYLGALTCDGIAP